MKNNKNILRLLIAALIIVWGLIVYQVISTLYFNDDEEIIDTENLIKNQDRNKAQFVYDASVRDPFQFRAVKIDTGKHRSKSKSVVPAWTPPPFFLKGIIDAKSGKMAVLENQAGETFFLQRGDTLQGLRILSIEPNRVQYVFNKKKSDWQLEEN